MKKLLLLLLFISSFTGYLEWGNGQYGFIWQEELVILQKGMNDPAAVFHPFILLPLFGQVLLLISLLRTRPERWLLFSGIAALAVLFLFLLLVGLLSSNVYITAFSLPFILLSLFAIRVYQKTR